MKNAIFDLDMTLVDSSIAESARKQRDWQNAYSLIPRFSLYPGMNEVFEFIRFNRIRVAIVSTSPRPYVERVCQFYDIPTNVVLGYHDCGRIKPAPDGLIRAMAAINTTIDNTVSFGDRVIDIQASIAANIPAVACLWGSSEGSYLVESGSVASINNPIQIIDYLR